MASAPRGNLDDFNSPTLFGSEIMDGSDTDPTCSPVYQCIACALGSLRGSAESWICNQCTTSYPIAGGLPVFVRRPYRLVEAGEATAQATRAHAQRFAESGASRFSERHSRAAHAMIENLSLIDATSSLDSRSKRRRQSRAEALLDELSSTHYGWSLDELLPYFHQDWAGRSDVQDVVDLISRALNKSVPDREAVVVLGAAGCGLLYALARQFDWAYGVDLSLHGLALARRVLDGEEVKAYLRMAAWRPMNIRRSAGEQSNIRLLIADAVSLPFESASQSAVVTQYLMDAVSNPWAVIDEIARVLKPGGIWVNFSLPFRLPDEPVGCGRPDIDELAAALAARELAVVESANVRFSPLDVSGLDSGTMTVNQSVQFFLARRAPMSAAAVPRHELHDARWWRSTPRIARGRSVEIASALAFSAAGVSSSRCMRMQGAVGSFEVARCAEEDQQTMEAVLHAIDGQRSHREIQESLATQALLFDDRQYGELMYYLSRRDGLIVTDLKQF